MRRQWNIFQTKEPDKTSEELSIELIGNLPDKECKVMITKMIKKLGKRMDEQYEKLEVLTKS